MATFTARTITSTRREWIIPAAEPWGASAAEVGKAWTAAQDAYRVACEIPVGTGLPDDALRFKVTDEAIVISFTTEAQQPAPTAGHVHTLGNPDDDGGILDDWDNCRDPECPGPTPTATEEPTR